MPFGVVSDGVGRKMGVLDGGGDHRRESGSFRSKREAFRCNYKILCVRAATRLSPNYFGIFCFPFIVHCADCFRLLNAVEIVTAILAASLRCYHAYYDPIRTIGRQTVGYQ